MDNAFVRIESSQFIKGADPSDCGLGSIACNNDIARWDADPSETTVKFFCPNGTTGTPFKMQKQELSTLKLPPTKQVVSCK